MCATVRSLWFKIWVLGCEVEEGCSKQTKTCDVRIQKLDFDGTARRQGHRGGVTESLTGVIGGCHKPRHHLEIATGQHSCAEACLEDSGQLVRDFSSQKAAEWVWHPRKGRWVVSVVETGAPDICPQYERASQ